MKKEINELNADQITLLPAFIKENIIEFSSKYNVNSKGFLFSKSNGCELEKNIHTRSKNPNNNNNNNSQLYSRIFVNNKRYKVKIHRLMAIYFIPRTNDDVANNRNEVIHLNYDLFDNRIENLCWANRTESINFYKKEKK